MKALRIVAVIIGTFVTLPITLWLQYQILARVQASELMWFLYWVNLPVVFLASLLLKLVEKAE
jgi:hypothetical protein